MAVCAPWGSCVQQQVEWVLRPYFNRQKEALALPEDTQTANNHSKLFCLQGRRGAKVLNSQQLSSHRAHCQSPYRASDSERQVSMSGEMRKRAASLQRLPKRTIVMARSGRGFACDFSRCSLVTSQFGLLVTSCFLSSRNAELSWFSENRVTPKP